MRYRKLIVLTLVFTLFILTVPAQMLASAAVRPWGGSVGSWEDSIKEWQNKEWKDRPSSSAEQQWLDYLKQNHPELYEQYINEWLNEVKKTDPALYEQYMKQWQNGQGDFSPFDGAFSPLDGNYLQWQQLKLRELPFDTLAPTYNGPLDAVLPSLLMTGSLFAPKGMEIFSIFNRTISGDNNAFSLFAPLSPQELMMNQFFSLSFMKGIQVAQTSGDGKSGATEKQTPSASNNGGTIEEASQKDKPWYKKAGDWIGNQYKSVKDAAHSNAGTGEVWDFLIADAEGTITGIDPITGEKLSGINRSYNIATTVFKPLKVVDKIADGANAARKAEKIKDTKKQSVGRKEDEGAGNPRTRLPKTGGKWEGEPGNGKWYSDKPEVHQVTSGEPVIFKDGRPDFSPWSKGSLKFKDGQLDGTQKDFNLVYAKIKQAKGFSSQKQAQEWLREKGLTPHHLDNNTIQLIPTKLHRNVPHVGAASDMRGGY
ncbi:phage terminase large subunit-like protein [Bacillus fengqiuensis]|nr:phage terminase large subunit-like protein [Bacillus fengqiuensis]